MYARLGQKLVIITSRHFSDMVHRKQNTFSYNVLHVHLSLLSIYIIFIQSMKLNGILHENQSIRYMTIAMELVDRTENYF